MSIWFVNGFGLVAIAAIVWWFWWPQRAAAVRATTGTDIEVVVADGVYQPALIEIPAGQAVQLRFLRKDPSPCAAQVVFGTLDISADLTVGKVKSIALPPLSSGEYPFTCQMGMYQGRLRVV